VRLDIVRDEAGFAALEPHWDKLLDQGSTCSPFLRWDWMRLWWAEFYADFELIIAVVRDEAGAPLAIAPLTIGREHEGLRRHLRHLGFMSGFGMVQGERMDFLVPAGKEAELTPILCQVFQRLEGEWDAIRLNKIPEESPNYPYIMRALEAHCVGVSRMVRSTCACILLKENWHEFERELTAKQRRKIRRRMELLEEKHTPRSGAATGQDAAQRLDELADLHRQHFPDGISGFIAPRAWHFHRQLGMKWLASGLAMLPFIEIGAEMVCGIYGFVERDEFFFFQLGWKAEYAPFAMGHLGIRWGLELSMKRKLRVFDLLPGAYRYKMDWAQTSRYVVDLEAYPSGNVRAAVFRSIRWAKRHVKKTLLPKISE
jgi:CelD/BcsL family acetyltransferase involved in cellulose biosynthesis